MKKKILLILASVLVFSLAFTGCSNGDDNEKETNINEENKEVETDDENESSEEGKDTIMDKGTLIMGLDDSFPPMGFRDDDGEIVGFDIDLATEAAERMELEIEFKPVDWASKVLVLNKGDIDVIWNGFTANDERREQVNFTEPYLGNKQILVVQNDSEVENKSDLEGRILGLQSGSTSQEALESEKEVEDSLKEVKKYADNVKALLDLNIGRTDAVLVDEVVGKYYVAKKPDDYKILGEDFGEEEYAVGVRKGEDEFLKKLDEVLEEIREDGTESEISQKWFGEDIIKK